MILAPLFLKLMAPNNFYFNVVTYNKLQIKIWQIGSLMAEHKASYSLVFSDSIYRQNIAGR